MADWLTTHYPHPDPDDLPWHVYVRREHRHAVDGIRVGDRVFFYEFREQKPLKHAPVWPRGRQGVVLVASVSGSIYGRPGVVEYADGSSGDWCWGVPTSDADTAGFVAREDLLVVLQYAAGSYLRGFASGTGVKRLDSGQGDGLYRLFKSRPAVLRGGLGGPAPRLAVPRQHQSMPTVLPPKKLSILPTPAGRVTADQLGSWRRRLLRLLDAAYGPSPNEGLVARVAALKRADRLPRQTAALMIALAEIRNVAEHEGKAPTEEESQVARAAWSAIREWARSHGHDPDGM